MALALAFMAFMAFGAGAAAFIAFMRFIGMVVKRRECYTKMRLWY